MMMLRRSFQAALPQLQRSCVAPARVLYPVRCISTDVSGEEDWSSLQAINMCLKLSRVEGFDKRARAKETYEKPAAKRYRLKKQRKRTLMNREVGAIVNEAIKQRGKGF